MLSNRWYQAGFMNRGKLVLILLLICLYSLVYPFKSSQANTGNPPLGNTAAPGEGTCASCHSTFVPNAGTGKVLLGGLPREYMPGQTYTLTVAVVDETASRWGFELTALDEQNQTIGKLGTVDNSITDIRTGTVNGASREYLVPTINGNFTGLTLAATWDFTWTAPSSGTATFYITGLAADRDATPNGDFTYTNTYTTRKFEILPPSLNFLTPNKGSSNGQTMVNIGGSSFRPGVKVFFDGVEAQVDQATVTDTSIDVITPPHSVGTVDLRITNADGLTVLAPGVFTYIPPPAPAPKLFFVSPNVGPTSGQASIKLSGVNFTSGARVFIDGREVSTGFIDTNFLSVTTPLHDPGSVPIRVINPDGQEAILQDAYIYDGPVPDPIVKLNFDPTILSAGGATAPIHWTIDSNGRIKQRLLLSTDGGNTFPIVLATNLAATINSFKWTIPPDLTSDNARIRLEVTQPETGVIVNDLTKTFKIVTAPTIDLITPSTAQVGKTRLNIEIKGNNFAAGATVMLNDTKLKVLSVGATSIKIKKVPHMTPGFYFIKILNTNGGVSRNYVFTVSQ